MFPVNLEFSLQLINNLTKDHSKKKTKLITYKNRIRQRNPFRFGGGMFILFHSTENTHILATMWAHQHIFAHLYNDCYEQILTNH